MLTPWKDGLDPFREIAPFQQNPVRAPFALDSDVRPQTDHFPFAASAWMRLP
jgi:hypothetical protein